MKRITSPILFALGFIIEIAIVAADEPFVRFNTGTSLYMYYRSVKILIDVVCIIT